MCTTIQIDYKEGSVLGRTMDYEVPLKYNGLYFPRGYKYRQDLFKNPIVAKYRTLGICFENKDPLKDGVNEHGLVGVTNMFTGFNLFANKVQKGKKNISSFDYMTYALMNYKSVDELVADLDNIHLANRNIDGKEVISPDFHFMFVDSSKKNIILEPRKGKLIAYENPYKVMTNSPSFPSHVRKLKKYFDFDNLEDFNSAKDLPGGYDPSSRFIKAFYLNEMNKESETAREALANSYNIMSAMSMPNGFVENKKYNYTTYTRYICSYDTRSKLLTVKDHLNPTVYELGFEDIEDLDKRQEFYIKREFATEKIVDLRRS